MRINFMMWRKASWELIKIEDKNEWEALDVVSKWLIATRSAVTLLTIYSCIIAGILSWRDGYFSWLPWIIVTIGLFLAHGTNNILNDFTDFSRGLDQGNYFRTQYGSHPLQQEFWTKKTQILWFLISFLLAISTGIWALYYTNFSLITLSLFLVGLVVLLTYTYPLKYWGLGELMIFLIWGPIIVAGVYYVLSGLWNWNVFLAGIPFGLGVASINMAKHIDKLDDDKSRGVGTLPVRVGESIARRLDQIAIVMIYIVIVYLVFVLQYFTPVLLITLIAMKHAWSAIKILNTPKPKNSPENWEGWPVWFSAYTFFHNRQFGGLLILSMIIDALVRVFFPSFWPIL